MSLLQIDLGFIPKTRPHLMADYLELALVFSENDQISISDAHSLLRDGLICPEDEEAEKLEDSGPIRTTADKNQIAQERVLEWFRNMKYRSVAFDNFYPFYFQKDLLKLHKQLTKKRYLYLFLLICSRLKCFDKVSRSKLAGLFEIICAQALKQYVPQAKVKIFGAKSLDRKTHYGFKLKDAIRNLGNDIKESVIDVEVEKGIDNKDSGDSGLDLVASLDFKDDAVGRIVLFGQCAAREDDWTEKVFESHPDRLSRFFHFNHNPANILFIPLCYRQPSGNWVDASAHGVILLDRLRLCQLLEDHLPREISKANIHRYLGKYAHAI